MLERGERSERKKGERFQPPLSVKTNFCFFVREEIDEWGMVGEVLKNRDEKKVRRQPCSS